MAFIFHRSSKQKYLKLAVFVLVVCAVSGCVLPSQETVRGPELGQETAQRDESGKSQDDQGLIKPMISAEALPAAEPPPVEPVPIEPPADLAPRQKPVEQSTPATPAPSQVKDQAPPKLAARSFEPSGGLVPKRSDTAAESHEWEDQKVKHMALELAAKSPETKKVRICYAVKDNEWWIILYEDAGAFYELKQYIWDKDQDKLEPFLVLKKIPKSRFEEHIKQSEPNRACEMLELPSTDH